MLRSGERRKWCSRGHGHERHELKKLMCWIWGHDRMQTGARLRVCLRCGQREKLRDFGRVLGWEELSKETR